MDIFSELLKKGCRRSEDDYADLDKELIKAIAADYVGKSTAVLSGSLLIHEGTTLFIDFHIKKILICGNTCEESFLNIISALALLRRLLDSGMIYEAENHFAESILLVYSGKVNYDIGAYGHLYTAEHGGLTLSDPFGRPVLNQEECKNYKILEGKIAEEFISWLRAEIYPTSALIDFVNNGFLTKEDCRFKTTIRNTKISIFIAFAALVLSPVLTTCHNNKYGITTINAAQLDSLVHKMDSIASCHPVIVPVPQSSPSSPEDKSRSCKP